MAYEARILCRYFGDAIVLTGKRRFEVTHHPVKLFLLDSHKLNGERRVRPLVLANKAISL